MNRKQKLDSSKYEGMDYITEKQARNKDNERKVINRELDGTLKAIDPREQVLFTVRLTRKDILCLPMETRRRILSEQVKRLDDMNLAEYHHFID